MLAYLVSGVLLLLSQSLLALSILLALLCDFTFLVWVRVLSFIAVSRRLVHSPHQFFFFFLQAETLFLRIFSDSIEVVVSACTPISRFVSYPFVSAYAAVSV
jgi:hypothetical protein